MEIQGLIVIGVPLFVLTLSIYLAYRYANNHNRHVLAWMGALWLAFTGLMFVGMETAPGWDALIYMFALIGLSAPSGIGGLIGGILGWVKKDNEKYA